MATAAVDVAALALYALAMCITPGPNVLMLTASGALHGYRASLPHLLGASLGTGLQTLLVALGAAEIFSRWPGLQVALAWVGAAYLLWLGWRLLLAPAGPSQAGGRPLGLAAAGLFQALNPKAWLMALSTVGLFLPPAPAGWTAPLLLAAVMAGVNAACLSVWTLFGSALRNWIAAPRRRRMFNLAMAALLALSVVPMLRA